MADGGEDGVGGVTGGSLEIAAGPALGFHVAEHGLDGGAASQLALDDAEHAALLSGDEDTMRVVYIVAASYPRLRAGQNRMSAALAQRGTDQSQDGSKITWPPPKWRAPQSPGS